MEGISVGAVGAALIAAIASFVGLILGKEAKTSEFRQQWIDALRSEISIYLSNVLAIGDRLKQHYRSNSEKVKDLVPYYHNVNSAGSSIRLRLNPNESKSKAVLDAMERIDDISKSDDDLISDKLQVAELEMLTASQDLLKSEWNRVKKGELTFRITKYVALAISVFLLGLLIYAAIHSFLLTHNPEAKQPPGDAATPAKTNAPPHLPGNRSGSGPAATNGAEVKRKQ